MNRGRHLYLAGRPSRWVLARILVADDAKFYGHILSDDDNKTLQYALDALPKWSEKWLLNLNTNKCQIVTFGRSVDKPYKYTIRSCTNQTIPLERIIQVLDLGVCFDK